MNKADRISFERCINNAKHRNRTIAYGEGFNQEVNRHKKKKNDKQIDKAKKEVLMEKKFGE